MCRAALSSCVEIIDPLQHPYYFEWIANSKESTIFHSPQWAMLLNESYRYRPRYFTLNRGERIIGCLPIIEVDSFVTGKRGVSVSFSDYCHSIVSDESDFALLLQSVLDYGRI